MIQQNKLRSGISSSFVKFICFVAVNVKMCCVDVAKLICMTSVCRYSVVVVLCHHRIIQYSINWYYPFIILKWRCCDGVVIKKYQMTFNLNSSKIQTGNILYTVKHAWKCVREKLVAAKHFQLTWELYRFKLQSLLHLLTR